MSALPDRPLSPPPAVVDAARARMHGHLDALLADPLFTDPTLPSDHSPLVGESPAGSPAGLLVNVEAHAATQHRTPGVGLGDAETELSPGLRPDLPAGTEDRRRRQATEDEALFGSERDAELFGHHRLLHRLGVGGMGIVYAAYDDRLDRKVAFKLIRPTHSDDAEANLRVLREARVLARLSHPHVVHIYEAGEINGQIFLAMEFLSGPTLRAWLDEGEHPWPEVLAVLRQAGEGLAAAHAQGITHRDFKPQNLMFGADGRLRVLDFGLATFARSEVAPTNEGATGTDEPARHALTATGALLGTPAYMSPEQWAGRPADALSDQFSFCVTLFEALYGRRPFSGDTYAAIAETVTSGRPPVRPRDSRVPEWVHAALLRGLHVDPKQRWPTMPNLLAALSMDPKARRRAQVRRYLVGAALVVTTAIVSRWVITGPDSSNDATSSQAETEAARRQAKKSSDLRIISESHRLLETEPQDVIPWLSHASLDSESAFREARVLALAALSRGLPDISLVAPVVKRHQMPTMSPTIEGFELARSSGDVFAYDSAGDLWRWNLSETDDITDHAQIRGVKIGHFAEKPTAFLPAPTGSAWVARQGAELVGAHEVGDSWTHWRALTDERVQMLTSDGAWSIGVDEATITVRDLSDGSIVSAPFPGSTANSDRDQILVSPDARFLARGTPGDEVIRLWDRRTGLTRSLRAPSPFVDFDGFTPDLEFVLGHCAVADPEAEGLVAWNVRTEQPEIIGPRAEFLHDIGSAFSGVFRRSGADDGICYRALNSPFCLWSSRRLEDPEVTTNGRFFAFRRSFETSIAGVEIGDIETGQPLRWVQVPDPLDEGRLDRTGRYYVARDKIIEVWESAQPMHKFVEYSDLRRSSVPWSDGERRQALSHVGTITADYDPEDGHAIRLDVRAERAEELLPCQPDGGGGFSAVVDESGRVGLWNAQVVCLYPPTHGFPVVLQVPGPPASMIRGVALSPGGESLAVGLSDGTARVWWRTQSDPIAVELGSDPMFLAFASEDRLVSAGASGHMRAHSPGGTRVLREPGQEPLAPLKLSGDGRWLAGVERKQVRVVLHDLVEEERPAVVREVLIPQPGGRVPLFTFSESDALVLAVSHDGSRVVVGDGKHLYSFFDSFFGEFKQSPSEILSLAFADLGHLVFAATADGAVRMWSAPTQSWETLRETVEFESDPTVLAWTDDRKLILPDAMNDALTVVVERGVHYWKIGMIPDEPEPLRQWLRAQAARFEAPQEKATGILDQLGYFSTAGPGRDAL